MRHRMTKWGIGLLLSWLKKSLFIWNPTQDILSSWYTVLLIKFTLFIILISCRLGSFQRFAQHSMVIRWSTMYLQSTLISSGKNLKARSPISGLSVSAEISKHSRRCTRGCWHCQKAKFFGKPWSRDALVFGMSSQNNPAKAVPSDLSSLVLFLKTLVHERSGIQHVALRVEELEVLRHRRPGGHVWHTWSHGNRFSKLLLHFFDLVVLFQNFNCKERH